MAAWTRAGEVPELADWFRQVPPPVDRAQPSYSAAQGTPPKSWLIESILVTIFCCMPLGIIGIIFASKVESRFYAGNVQGAIRASKDAELWTKASIGVAVVGIIVSFFFGLFPFLFGIFGGFW